MSAPPHLSSALFDTLNIAHGFFGREGGVSKGAYASLNTGPGSNDNAADVAENRRRCAAVLGVKNSHLLTSYQIHSADVIAVEAPWNDAPAKADALVTKTPGIALGVLAADCMPFLFVEPKAKIIGAAHAGWRGALAGVLENTVAAMERLGADRTQVCAAIGPCLRQPNFEVGLELIDAFLTKHPESEKFFAPGKAGDKRQIDLAGFGAWRLRESGVCNIDNLGVCTLAAPDHYFSYRAMKRTGGTKYGRNLSAITLG